MLPIHSENPISELDEMLRMKLRQEHRGIITCRHEKSLKPYLRTLWGFSERELESESKDVQIPCTTGLQRCPKMLCVAEFQFDVFKYSSGELVCVITTWRDLGRCMNPYDRRFRCHFNEYGDSAVYTCQSEEDDIYGWADDTEDIDFEAGEIKSAFEDKDQFHPEEYLAESKLDIELRKWTSRIGERLPPF